MINGRRQMTEPLKQTKPAWLTIRIPASQNDEKVTQILARHQLNTVCTEAFCPNRGECYGRNTAAFMILGRQCTRNCTFCNVSKSTPEPVDPEEPVRLANAVRELELKHVVVTSVTRDDLPDGGASHFARTILEARKRNPNVTIEVLIPDFGGDAAALETVVSAGPDIINHNLETVPRLYPRVRPMAKYDRSLALLLKIRQFTSAGSPRRIHTKSGLMLGLGETEPEVMRVLQDLRQVDCDFVTIGQYLAPSRQHHPVVEYVPPETFEKYRLFCLEAGFVYAACGPLVRSSYHADRALEAETSNEPVG